MVHPYSHYIHGFALSLVERFSSKTQLQEIHNALVRYQLKFKSEYYGVYSGTSGHGGDEHFVHCSEVVPSSEVLPLSSIIIIISLVCESQ